MTATRRHLLLAAATSAWAWQAAWAKAMAPDAVPATSPYGPLGPPDADGVRLPAGFVARRVATSGQVVGATGHRWHFAPDGGATFAAPGGDWVYVSNAELPNGGVGAIRFAPDGGIVDAYSILDGTRINCAGGPTPWGRWLSCEEFELGQVWECDPQAPGQGLVRPALGRFAHEAAAVDPSTGFVYLTEDHPEGRLYRFRPARPGDLSEGVLEAAAVASTGSVGWRRVSPLRPARDEGTTAFARGEGAWFDGGTLYFCTTADNRVWALHTASQRLAVVYDAAARGPEAPLRRPDNVTVHAASGDVFVAEDGDDNELVLLADAAGQRIAAPFMQLVGHEGSEVAGQAFSPDGTRLYVSSQRGTGGRNLSPGITFEVRGPFRRR